MTVQKLIQLAERRLARLEQERVGAENAGDIDAMSRIDVEITETTETLNQLRPLVAE